MNGLLKKRQGKMEKKEVFRFAAVGFFFTCLIAGGALYSGFTWMSLGCLIVVASTHLATLYMLYNFYKGGEGNGTVS